METTVINSAIEQEPLFTPTYLNIEYVFQKIIDGAKPVLEVLSNPDTWTTLGTISALLSIACIALIIWSLVRMIEIQIHEKHELEHEIHEATVRQQEIERNANPRWHYVMTLTESPNESDWRVAIIEADSMMEEILRDKGFSGETLSELLEAAKESGYRNIQDAWEGHLVRNQIAHQGSDYALSQVEGRRIIKMFQNFFEELGVI